MGSPEDLTSQGSATLSPGLTLNSVVLVIISMSNVAATSSSLLLTYTFMCWILYKLRMWPPHLLCWVIVLVFLLHREASDRETQEGQCEQGQEWCHDQIYYTVCLTACWLLAVWHFTWSNKNNLKFYTHWFANCQDLKTRIDLKWDNYLIHLIDVSYQVPMSDYCQALVPSPVVPVQSQTSLKSKSSPWAWHC